MSSDTDTHAADAGAPAAGRVRLRAEGIGVGYGAHTVIDDLDLDVVEGTVTAIIGPNGCGKSTLLRALARLMPVRSGRVLLDGRPLGELSSRQVATTLGVLPQAPRAPEGLTVADLVARGRHPHQTWYRQWSSDDESVVAEALSRTGMLDLARRPIEQLSGGQRQRAWISMVLAQGTDLLLLDEPTTFLDLAHQVDVLELVSTLHRDAGRTVLMVLHDLHLAARYADRLVAMDGGRIAAQGAPADVLTEELLADVFGLDATVVPDPHAGAPMVIPRGGRRAHGPSAAPPST